MAQLTIDNQTSPTTPAASKSVIFVDSTAKKLAVTDDGGTHRGGTLSKNALAAQLTGFAADQYVTGSSILIPAYGMQVGQLYRWEVSIEKTAAGVALIAVTIRTGANQSTADTSRVALTQTVAQAATASVNTMFVSALVRSVGGSGILVGAMGFTGTQMGDGDRVVPPGFDNTAMQGLYIGLSLNGGASAAYTIDSAVGYLVS